MRSEEARRKELEQIEQYRKLVDLVNAEVQSHEMAVSIALTVIDGREELYGPNSREDHKTLEREPRVLHNLEPPKTCLDCIGH